MTGFRAGLLQFTSDMVASTTLPQASDGAEEIANHRGGDIARAAPMAAVLMATNAARMVTAMSLITASGERSLVRSTLRRI